MPRKARIDAPGALHHIIFRGIERRKIFRDNKHRDNFLDRLGNVLSDSGTPCYAWALIPNRRIEIYFFTYVPYGLFDFEDDDLNGFGFYEGECQGCDIFQSLNDMGLCEECAQKLDRDLIRQRDWAYSVSAFGVPESRLEDIRKEVIKQYGAKHELIAPPNRTQKKSKKKKRKKKKSGKRQ